MQRIGILAEDLVGGCLATVDYSKRPVFQELPNISILLTHANKTRSFQTGSFLMSSEGDVRGERLIENNRLTTAPAIKKQAASTK